MSWAVIRSRFPALRTLPSRTVLTRSFSPMKRMSSFLPLNVKEDVNAIFSLNLNCIHNAKANFDNNFSQNFVLLESDLRKCYEECEVKVREHCEKVDAKIEKQIVKMKNI